MQYKYIFWDFNGTIMDDVSTALACVNDILARRDRAPITLNDYYAYVDTPIIKFYYHILPPEEVDANRISAEFHSDYLIHAKDAGLAPYAKELLLKLKKEGVHQYIVSANNLDEIETLLNEHGIYDCFEQILGVENSLSASKTEMAKKLINSLNINKNEAIFIGDTLHDSETANAMGINCVLVEYGHQGKKLLGEHKAFTVPTLKDVEKLLYDERVVDLHTHSTCSDGSLTPAEVVELAKKSGLSAVALTDHDNIDGIKEASEKAKELHIEFIPGIEFSAADETETHIVGLFIDPENEDLLNTVNGLKSDRVNRMKKTCENLCNLGFDITFDEAKALSETGYVGRPHIAELMVKKGYCKTVKECFDKYIAIGKPAFVIKRELSAIDAVKVIKKAGGIAILAHLHQTKFSNEKLFELLKQLKAAGLDGIEGYYTEYTDEHISDYRAMAEKLSLLLSGGSDFHGKLKPDVSIKTGYGNLRVPYYIVENMKNNLK